MAKKGRAHTQPNKPAFPIPIFSRPASPKPTAQYNIVYEKLVEGDIDVIGQLAYCLYKQSKQQYLKTFESLNGRRPTDDELRNHVDCAEIPALELYEEKAERVVSSLLAHAAQEKQDELENHFNDRLWKFIDRHQHESFGERSWHSFKELMFGGAGGVVGNFFTTALVLFFLFWAASGTTRDEFSKSAKESLVSGLAEIIGVGITLNGAHGTNQHETPTPAKAPRNDDV